MSIESSGRIFAALGGNAIVGFIARRLGRPKFKIELCCDPQSGTPKPEGRDLWDRSIWIRIRVVNESRWYVAKNVRPYLVGVQFVRPDGGVVPLIGKSDKREIPWQNDVYQIKPRDLHHQVLNAIDVAYTQDEHAGLFTCARPPFNASQPGIYRFAVLIEADNSPATRVFLRVAWDGLWHSLSVTSTTMGEWVDDPSAR